MKIDRFQMERTQCLYENEVGDGMTTDRMRQFPVKPVIVICAPARLP
jgi:hypothetical protein